MKLNTCAAAAAALLIACGSGSPREELFGPEIPSASVVLETRHSGVEQPLRAVIRSEAEWRPIRETLTGGQPGAAVRSIDFRREMVIVAALGEQLETGRTVTFGGIQRVTGEIIAEVVQVLPDPRCETVEIRTTPLAAVAVPRSDAPVRFIERSIILDGCP
jgi:hypothetical protein